MSMSAARADDSLEAALDIGGTGVYVQLHTGSPGTAGTANVAQYDDGGGNDPAVRKLVEFAAVENHPSNTERRSLSSSAVSWSGSEINSGQEITHFSIWSAETNGQVEFIAAVDTPKTTGSDGVTIAIGDLEAAITVFAKP